jgi:tRNA threonylcarbamoyladenosine biosynthesis protein TsaE
MQMILANEKAQLTLGAKLAKACDDKTCVIFLQGDLGAGKTTLARGFLKALGYNGNVKSPTYTLVETYQLKKINILHLDLYRILHPKEILNLGLFDLCSSEKTIYLIEWPEKAVSELPKPDITCSITSFEKGRICQITAQSLRGEEIIHMMDN